MSDKEKLLIMLLDLYPSWKYVDLTKMGYTSQRTVNILELAERIEEMYEMTITEYWSLLRG